MKGFCSAGLGRQRAFLSVLSVFIACAAYLLLASALPSYAPTVRIEQNSSANYDNDGLFAVNWSFGAYAGGDIVNYTVYIFNNTGGVPQFFNATANNSPNGYYFNAGINGGNYTFNISAVNSTGDESPNGTSAWVFVDLQNATIALTSPENGNLTLSSTAIFNFNVTDNGSATLNCSVNMDGTPRAWNSSVRNNTATAISVSGIVGGAHQWNVTCVDLALNYNTSEMRILNVDLSAPSVTLNAPLEDSWQDPGQNVTFNYTVSDDLWPRNCSIYITNASNQNFSYVALNASALLNGSSANSFSRNLTTMPGELNYTWGILCYDAANKSGWSSNGTFHIGNRPDLIISNIYLVNSSNILSALNPIPGSNITFNVTVKNTGAQIANGAINITFVWGGYTYNGSFYSLGAGLSWNVTFNIPSTLVGGPKPYTVTASVDGLNSVIEANESNNELSKIVFTGLNITLLNITPAEQIPGQQLLVNFSATYQNGSAVVGLQSPADTNIIVIDNYSIGLKATELPETALTYSGQYYWFNITVPIINATTTRADVGAHKILLFVSKNASGDYYNNSWYLDSNSAANTTSKYYTLNAPSLEVRYNPDSANSIDLAYATSKSFTIHIKNNGTANISNISISITTNSTSLTISNNSVNYSTAASCHYAPVLSYIANSSFMEVPGCSIVFNTTTAGRHFITIIASGLANTTQYKSMSVIQEILVSNSTAPSSTTSSGGSSGGAGTITTYTYLLNITKYNSSAFIEQGKSGLLSFTVKNKGNGTVNNITFSMSLPQSISWANWYAMPPKISRLAPGASAQVTTNVSVPANATIGISTVTAKFEGSESGSSTTATFVLQVLPGETERESINISLSGFSAQILSLNATLSSLIEKSGSENLIVAKNKLSRANALLNDANAAIIAGDYLSAYDAKTELSNILSDVREIVSAEKTVSEEKQKKTDNILIAVGIIAVLAALGYYLWAPEEGYNPKNGAYSFKGKGGSIIGRIGGIFRGAAMPLRINPAELIEKVSEKKVQSGLLNAPGVQQPFSYTPSESNMREKLRQMQSNLKEQLAEYKNEDKKPVYNFQKKKSWSPAS